MPYEDNLDALRMGLRQGGGLVEEPGEEGGDGGGEVTAGLEAGVDEGGDGEVGEGGGQGGGDVGGEGGEGRVVTFEAVDEDEEEGFAVVGHSGSRVGVVGDG